MKRLNKKSARRLFDDAIYLDSGKGEFLEWGIGKRYVNKSMYGCYVWNCLCGKTEKEILLEYGLLNLSNFLRMDFSETWGEEYGTITYRSESGKIVVGNLA